MLEWIQKEIRHRVLHFTLIDPDKADGLKEKVKTLERMGSDAVMVGGSTGINQKCLDSAIKLIKKHSSLPVILFPGGINGVSGYADAIFFMSLMNSKNPYWITGAQAAGAERVQQAGLEPISMGYIVIEPGGAVGRVGEADLITNAKKAVSYALAAQLMGMSLVYLEAGSGAERPVPVEMVKKVRKAISIPLVVGGGIRSAAAARERAKAGADIIVTGNITEDNFEAMKGIVKAVKGVKR